MILPILGGSKKKLEKVKILVIIYISSNYKDFFKNENLKIFKNLKVFMMKKSLFTRTEQHNSDFFCLRLF